MNRGRHLLISAAMLVAASPPALAETVSDDDRVRYLAGTCTNCHGTQGRSAGAMPALAGMQAPLLVERMAMFREGRQPATIMHQIAKGYSVRETEALAAYFARQSPTSGEKGR